MRKFVTLASTAIVAAGTGWIGLGQPSYLCAQDAAVTVHAGPKNTDSASARSDTQAARGVLAKATEAALSDNAVQNLSERLVAADRDRVRSGNVDATNLNATLTTLRNDWKAKYGSEFAIADPAVTLDHNPKHSDGKPMPTNVTMGSENRSPARFDAAPRGDYTSRSLASLLPAMGGEKADAHAEVKTQTNANAANTNADGTVTANGGANPAATDTGAMNGLPAQSPAAEGVQRTTDSPRITDNTTGQEADRAQAAASTVEPADREMKANTEMTKASKPEVVYYTIPAGQGTNIDTLKLVNEGGDWKIDIDDSIDGNKLAANLDKHLKMVVAMKDKWPADVAEAQRAVSHHVASALNDTSK